MIPLCKNTVGVIGSRFGSRIFRESSRIPPALLLVELCALVAGNVFHYMPGQFYI